MECSELGKIPITAEQPAGSEARYAPGFVLLQEEIDKLASPAAANAPDWEQVARLAAEILASQSKDLLAAGYLAVALIHTRAGEGLTLGLKIYLDLLENYWEELHPPQARMRGRIRALEWWIEKTEAALKQHDHLLLAPDRLAPVREHLDRLDDFLQAHLPDAPSLAPIREQCSARGSATDERRAPAGEVPADSPFMTHPAAGDSAAGDPAVDEPAAGEPSRSVIPTAAPKVAPHRDAQQDPMAALNDGLLAVSQAAFHLWQQDLASPLPYRLARQVAWYAVNELPPADHAVTRIPPPSSQEKKLLADLREAGDAEALLRAAERRQAHFIFWFDLSRLVAEALDLLGSAYLGAREAVCQETGFLLHRLPGLAELCFSDGTPFATQETRNWLKRIALGPGRLQSRSLPAVPGATGPEAGAAEPDAGAESVIERKIGELQELVQTGKLIEAMEVVQQKLRGSSSHRENLLWRLSLSQMLVDLGQSRLALPHLEQVLNDIAGHGLEQYDPSLALRGYKLAWAAFDSQAERRFKEQALDVLHQIGRFDMAEMVRLTQA